MKKLAVLLLILIFVVGCAQQPAASPAPEPSKPAQPQTPPPQPSQPQASPPAAPTQTANTVSVAIKGFKFVPAEVNVNVGDTIVWTNEDTAPHTVESSDRTLRSDELSKGDTYSYKFTKAGKYDYICGIHPSMKGSVTVQ